MRPIRTTRSSIVRNANTRLASAKIQPVTGSQARKMLAGEEGWTLLDVRSPCEAVKVPILGAVHVPIFKESTAMDVGSVFAKSVHFGMGGGWWTGGTHMVPNGEFLEEVNSKVSPDAKVIVACQKGLRSLQACKQLCMTGEKDIANIAWINGGCDACRDGDLPTEGGIDVRYAGIGGLSEILGWTEVQRAERKEKLGGAQGVINVFVGILAIDVALFVIEYLHHWII